jgi:hypothetical protein
MTIVALIPAWTVCDVRKIDEFIASLSTFESVLGEHFDRLFDPNGRLKHPSGFRARLYHGGVDASIRAQVLPFALGLYPLDAELRDEFPPA